MRRGRFHRVGHLLERRDVIHDVERAPMRGDHDVALLEYEIVHRNDRQIETKTLPVRPVVRGIPNAALRTGYEETALRWILAHNAREFARVDPGVDARPRRA